MAFHLELADARRDDYRAVHGAVPDALEAVYLDEEAGLQSYRIFEKDGHVFGYFEVDDPAALDEAVSVSETVTERNDQMDHLIAEQAGLDWIYRVI